MPGIRWKGMGESKRWSREHGSRPVPEDGPRKPQFHQACNGCGLCCVEEPCAVARILIPDVPKTGPCPALEWRDGRSWCGMVLRPSHYSSLVRDGPYNDAEASQMIQDDLGGMDTGCDSAPSDGPDVFAGMTAAEYLGRRR